MPTQPYLNAAGVRVPGTTTIIGQNLGWSKDGLMFYAWKKGKDGKDFRDYTKNAADIGTIAHAMVEEHIHGRVYVPAADALPEHIEVATEAFDAYRAWARGCNLEITHTEVAFVSEQWQFGGCIDAIGLADDADGVRRRCIVDWKTSNGTYADQLIQLRAYKHGWEETHPEEPLDGGFHLCRFAKEGGNFVHHWWAAGRLEPAWKVFTHLRNIHEQKAILERLAK